MPLTARYSLVQTSQEIRQASLSGIVSLDLVGEDGAYHADLRVQNVMHEPERLIILALDPDRLETVNIHVPYEGADDTFEPYAQVERTSR